MHLRTIRKLLFYLSLVGMPMAAVLWNRHRTYPQRAAAIRQAGKEATAYRATMRQRGAQSKNVLDGESVGAGKHQGKPLRLNRVRLSAATLMRTASAGRNKSHELRQRGGLHA